MKQPSLNATLSLIVILACITTTTLASVRAHTGTGMLESPAGVLGEVVQIATGNRNCLLRVKTDSGATVSIIVSDDTEVKRLPAGDRSIENALPIAATEILPGDRVYARGARPDDSGTARARQLIVMSRIQVAPERELQAWEIESAGIGTMSAQQRAGSLCGQVTDQEGRAVTGAALMLIRKDGAENRSVTNSKGVYSLDGLAPGSYALRLAAAGFAPYENDQVRVHAGSRQTLDITLRW